MRLLWKAEHALLGAVFLLGVHSCSPSRDEQYDPESVSTASAGGSARGGGPSGSGGTHAPMGGMVGRGGLGSAPPVSTGGASDLSVGCGIVIKPEQIIAYNPIGMFIMQDRSGSMVSGYPPPASPFSWNTSTAAIAAFVNDPSSSGLHVGLGAFPPLFGAVDCSGGSDCGTPVVPMAPLPDNAGAMASGMQTSYPINAAALTPTECGIRGMVNQCQAFAAAMKLPCVGVLVTDGTPTQCDVNMGSLAQLVAGGASQGMKTFVIGLPGSNIPALTSLAIAGGTGTAIEVSVNGAASFVAALNMIRGAVTTGTPLQCQWGIPPPPDNLAFDPSKVNVAFTPMGGAARDFGYTNQVDCAGTVDSWYFDDPTQPKQILLCPNTCDMLKTTTGATVDVSFGCARKPAVIK